MVREVYSAGTREGRGLKALLREVLAAGNHANATRQMSRSLRPRSPLSISLPISAKHCSCVYHGQRIRGEEWQFGRMQNGLIRGSSNLAPTHSKGLIRLMI